MRDNFIRRTIKLPLRHAYLLQLRMRRGWRGRVRGDAPRYMLEGSCQGCGQCCEEPAITTGAMISSLALLRAAFLLWQRHVNGFILRQHDRAHHTFSFLCTHYDPCTRQCDSYTSRPGMCRDYPRIVLDQDAPALFDACTHSLRLSNTGALIEAIDADPTLSDAQREMLKERLFLTDAPR